MLAVHGPELMAIAREKGVGLLCCGYNAASCRAVAELRASDARLQVAYGLHPWFAEERLEPVLERLESPDVSAVGEIGLDLWKDPTLPTLERQRDVLEVQLQLACRLNLPVTVHSRRAVDATVRALNGHAGLRAVFHAYSGSVEQAHQLVRKGYLIGVGGAVTRPRAQRLRRIVAEVPLDCLLLETDCPAIGMEGCAAEDVRPWHVSVVAAAVAEVKNVSLQHVLDTTEAAARGLFGYKG